MKRPTVFLWMRRWGGGSLTVFAVFAEAVGKRAAAPDEAVEGIKWAFPEAFSRKRALLPQAVFNKYHSEHEMLRYIRKLEARDLSLTTSMIPLGSCNEAQRGG